MDIRRHSGRANLWLINVSRSLVEGFFTFLIWPKYPPSVRRSSPPAKAASWSSVTSSLASIPLIFWTTSFNSNKSREFPVLSLFATYWRRPTLLTFKTINCYWNCFHSQKLLRNILEFLDGILNRWNISCRLFHKNWQGTVANQRSLYRQFSFVLFLDLKVLLRHNKAKHRNSYSSGISMYLLQDQSDCRIVEFERESCRIMHQGLNGKFFQVDGQTVSPYPL